MSKGLSAIVIAALAILGMGALYRLLLLQYESGDVYPKYSSFRSDPLGLLVLHDAVASLDGPAPRRSLAPLDQSGFPDRATLLIAGALISPDEIATLERLEAFVNAGGRLVILFDPDSPIPVKREEAAATKEEGDSAPGADEDEDQSEPLTDRGDDMLDALFPTQDISERWDFGYDRRERPEQDGEATWPRVTRGDGAPGSLPGNLLWRSELVFRDVSPAWQTIYRRGLYPVVIERPMGEGSVVLATETYPVSNEALRHERASSFVSWLIEPSRVLVFEETHLGVARGSGIMQLVRRYRLAPVLLVGVLLVLLFIWRNAASLVPKRAAPGRSDRAERAPSAIAGLSSLARRSVAPTEILDTCWRLYEAPTARRRPLDEKLDGEVQRVLSTYRDAPARRRDPVAAYNEIRSIVNERKAHP